MRPVAKLTVLCLMTLALVLPAQTARALIDDALYSEEEKAGFAFYKLGNVQPDFPSWIEESDAFKKGSPHQRLAINKNGYYRLEDGYLKYVPEEDLIFISTNVRLTRYPPGEDGRMPVKIELLEGGNHNGYPYFPLKIGKMWIGLVTLGMENFTQIAVEKNQIERFSRLLGFTENSVEAKIQIRLRPVAAETEEPMIVEDMVIWPMLSDIGTFSVWNKEQTAFAWSYQAPWFVPPDTSQLLKLPEGIAPVIDFFEE